MSSFLPALRYALRQFRHSPGFFTISVLLIAVGTGANTLIFTLVDTLLLRPLPVRDPQTLVQLFETRPNLPPSPYFAYGLYREIAERSSTLVDVAGQVEMTASLERGGEHGGYPERVHVELLTDNFLPTLGVQPYLGRLVTAGENDAALLSYAYWVRSFGRDPSVIGRNVRLQGHAFQIVGVAPPAFHGTGVETSADVLVSRRDYRYFPRNQNFNPDLVIIEIIARLRPGVSLAQAQEETAGFWHRYEESTEKDAAGKQWLRVSRLELQSIERGTSRLRNQFRTALILILAGTGVLLLMVCANVGGLLLARATAREKETAIRLALGASGARLARQWLAESLLLSGFGGAMGVLLTYLGMPVLLRWIPPVQSAEGELLPLALYIRPDLRIFAFCVIVCVVTAILAGLAPAWRAWRGDLNSLLKTTMSDRRGRRFQSVLAAVQVALCTVLLVEAGLVARSLSHLRSLDAGFDREHIVVFAADPRMTRYTEDQTWSLQRRLIDSVTTLPGVRAAAIASRGLMRGIGWKATVVFPGEKVPSSDLMNSSSNAVSPEYFATMGMRIIAGRGFSMAEKDRKPAPAIVNEAFVRRFFGTRDPIGQHFAMGSEYTTPSAEIIGIVSDAKYRSLRETVPPTFYSCICAPQVYSESFLLHVRTHGDPHAIIRPVGQILRSLDPEMPFFHAQTLDEEVDRSLWQERLTAALASWFGMFALTLAAIGMYGTLAYFVTARRREIGLRMAIGANRGNVARLVSRRVAGIVVIGGLAGLLGSLLIGQWIRSVLYGVRPADPLSMLAALAFLIAVAGGAAAIPTYRAIQIDPASTLREEP